MARILIIGIGNSLRSDDGIGWRVAQQLREELTLSDVNVIATQQLMPEIAEIISRAEKVLFVDAAQVGLPGSVRCKRIEVEESHTISHHMSPSGIVGLAQQLYGQHPEAFLLTVSGESFDVGERFSPSVEHALPNVRQVIERFLSYARDGDGAEDEFLVER
jgi:hydrogenase maturation protease